MEDRIWCRFELHGARLYPRRCHASPLVALADRQDLLGACASRWPVVERLALANLDLNADGLTFPEYEYETYHLSCPTLTVEAAGVHVLRRYPHLTHLDVSGRCAWDPELTLALAAQPALYC